MDQGVPSKWELTIRFAYNLFISQPIFFELKIKIGVAEAFALIRWYSIPEAKRGCQKIQTNRYLQVIYINALSACDLKNLPHQPTKIPLADRKRRWKSQYNTRS